MQSSQKKQTHARWLKTISSKRKNNKYLQIHTLSHTLSLLPSTTIFHIDGQYERNSTLYSYKWDLVPGTDFLDEVLRRTAQERSVYYILSKILDCDIVNQQTKIFCARELIVRIAAEFEWDNLTPKALPWPDHHQKTNSINTSFNGLPWITWFDMRLTLTKRCVPLPDDSENVRKLKWVLAERRCFYAPSIHCALRERCIPDTGYCKALSRYSEIDTSSGLWHLAISSTTTVERPIQLCYFFEGPGVDWALCSTIARGW